MQYDASDCQQAGGIVAKDIVGLEVQGLLTAGSEDQPNNTAITSNFTEDQVKLSTETHPHLSLRSGYGDERSDTSAGQITASLTTTAQSLVTTGDATVQLGNVAEGPDASGMEAPPPLGARATMSAIDSLPVEERERLLAARRVPLEEVMAWTVDQVMYFYT